MKISLRLRVERLDARMQALQLRVFQYGWIRLLPADFTGESHTVVVSRKETAPNMHWCQFEERPGPARLALRTAISRSVLREMKMKNSRWASPAARESGSFGFYPFVLAPNFMASDRLCVRYEISPPSFGKRTV